MTKWAYVDENGHLVDCVEIDPALCFIEEYAALFEELPDGVDGSYSKVDGAFVAPEEVVISEPEMTKVLSEGDFLACMTRAERQGITAARSANADFDDFMSMLEKKRNVCVSETETQTDIAAFVTAEIISQASADRILA